MTTGREKGTRTFTNDDYSESVPLWRALAEFTSEDLDEGLRANSAVIAGAKPPFVRSYNLASGISAIFTILFALSLIGLVIAGQPNWQNLFTVLSAATLLIATAPQLWRHVDQYGWKIPSAPLELPYPSDPHFEEFISILQKEAGPRAYRLRRAARPDPIQDAWPRRRSWVGGHRERDQRPFRHAGHGQRDRGNEHPLCRA